jgi:arginase
MELAFATGHGPPLLADIERRGPLVRETDVVAFAFRDADEQSEYDCQPLPPAITALDLTTVRQLGIETAAKPAVEHLTRPGQDGFLIHVDADSLSDQMMPAVDYRLPDGLTPEELVTVLKLAIASGRTVGVEVTIYNPALDSDGAAGRALTDALGGRPGAGPVTGM